MVKIKGFLQSLYIPLTTPKAFWIKVELCCATLPLYREPPDPPTLRQKHHVITSVIQGTAWGEPELVHLYDFDGNHVHTKCEQKVEQGSYMVMKTKLAIFLNLCFLHSYFKCMVELCLSRLFVDSIHTLGYIET